MIKIRTLPEGQVQLLEYPENHKNVELCIMVMSTKDITFVNLCKQINKELPINIPAKTIANYCVTLQERGYIRIIKS